MANLDRLRVLIEPDIVGIFTHCEITEIFATIDGLSGPQNVLILAVLEQRDAIAKPAYLNPKRLNLENLAGWNFGIRRSVVALADFLRMVETLEAAGTWVSSGDRLSTATLQPAAPQFVPPDQARPIPLNHILKNNFWAGSHIVEWADSEKSLFTPFFEKPERLKALAAAIIPYVPIDLAVVSDRLGNILVQVPVTVLTVQCGETRDDQGYYVRVAWRPGVAPRPLRVTVTADFDDTVTGLATAVIENEPITLPFPASPAQPHAYLLDETRDIVLAATGALSSISQINMQVHVMGSAEPRTFEYMDRVGAPRRERVALRPPRHDILVGEPRRDPNGDFTGKRLYRYETERVARERLFEQYGRAGSVPALERARALKDLAYLINAHGEEGAWLWDPYLDCFDVLDTLFASPHGGSDLRGLGRGKNVRDKNLSTFVAEQKALFAGVTGNLLALRFEFRVAHNMPNIDFHDRFLIFPKKDAGDLAWSLGISLNQIGEAHHILQRVEDGQRVSDAFQELWDRMGPDQMIWKHT
ncbi:VPA1262 family N-terminal domain-containing protein [Parvibaculum sp.]|uniref:VPA1262 family N-terminal domain-containing protein n=1 Tax=Parvibaculum sp. TaxID=2024848 RepID=UPI001E138908|nr:VPA1262 family N-terminal domain-containing protein [Parvibaculum sp.]MBX3488721.1 hypothetical protein [Parvibaculum sp.]MCW5727397.1 hypothetical protein [Parvibaculum sp.]